MTHGGCVHRWKLNACTGRLTNLGVTWAVAEAAAKATGADDNAAGELIFSGAARGTASSALCMRVW